VVSNALVVGGTGPTGVPIVNGLLSRGYDVTIFHTGAHPVVFDGEVERLIGDPRDRDEIASTLGDREWNLAVCTSGRLKAVARQLANRVGRLVAVTGQPVYAGSMRPTPEGRLPLPVPESAPVQRDAPGYTGKVAEGEDQLLAQHGDGDFEAVIVRYPGVYGPRSHLAHEWAIVRRILDGRPFAILPQGGTTYFQRGYVENLARLVLLAAEVPAAAGLVFNAGDERVLNAATVASVIADALGSSIELVGMPAQWCRGVFPLAEKSSLILDLGRARQVLGYHDVVGVEEATRLTALWLAEHRPAEGEVPATFAGRFDYEREDRLWARYEELGRMLFSDPDGDDRAPQAGRSDSAHRPAQQADQADRGREADG